MDQDQTTRPDRATIVLGLQLWAHGARDLEAAVGFVVETGTELLFARPTDSHSDIGRWWLDVFDHTDQVWETMTAGMSSGQKATWDLVRSLCDGELSRTLWRLDIDRRSALLGALRHALELDLVLGP